MKHPYLFLPALMFVPVFSSYCSKNNNANGPGTPGVVKYPATVTKTDVSGRLTTTYEYNSKNQLIGYKYDNGLSRDLKSSSKNGNVCRSCCK